MIAPTAQAAAPDEITGQLVGLGPAQLAEVEDWSVAYWTDDDTDYAPVDAAGSFTISGLRPGTAYYILVFDANVDTVFTRLNSESSFVVRHSVTAGDDVVLTVIGEPTTVNGLVTNPPAETDDWWVTAQHCLDEPCVDVDIQSWAPLESDGTFALEVHPEVPYVVWVATDDKNFCALRAGSGENCFTRFVVADEASFTLDIVYPDDALQVTLVGAPAQESLLVRGDIVDCSTEWSLGVHWYEEELAAGVATVPVYAGFCYSISVDRDDAVVEGDYERTGIWIALDGQANSWHTLSASQRDVVLQYGGPAVISGKLSGYSKTDWVWVTIFESDGTDTGLPSEYDYWYEWVVEANDGFEFSSGLFGNTYNKVCFFEIDDINRPLTTTLNGVTSACHVLQPGPHEGLVFEYGAALKAFKKSPVPTVSGTAKVGSKLSATAGSWSPKISPVYQWLRDGVPIVGATGSSYVLAAADLGASVQVQVTGQVAGYATTSKVSKAKVVAAGTLSGVTPKISGKAVFGETLSVNVGTWKTPGVVLSTQWFAGSVPIVGATGSSYTLAGSDVGKKITVKVTGTLDGYKSLTKASKATGKVALAKLSATPVPVVSGTAKVGETLSVDTGSWGPDPVGLQVQWYASGKAIKDATGTSLVLHIAQQGKKITVKVTGSKEFFKSVSKTSKATAKVVGLKLAATPVPVVSGTAKVGETLTVDVGVWEPDPVDLKVQWYASGKAIKGATGTSLTLASAQKGKTITVKVTGSKTDYPSVTKTSKATKKVAA
ncbi:MAG: hypothetical protein LBR58_05035 [Propionibacteriaceae bacterium]|nr:hypothetical protein [Propionibacteriaceae bacterium]